VWRHRRHERRQSSVLKHLHIRFVSEKGQTMPEYAVVLAILTITAAAVFTALSGASPTR
jgi:Flp pilus assembly pilin Flp